MRKPSAIINKYLFARSLFKDVRPGIEIGVIAGRQEVRNYMSGQWWDNNPVKVAADTHRQWGGIGKFTIELIESLCDENGKVAVCDGDCNGIVWGDQ